MSFAPRGITTVMNPLFFADWAHIDRVSRGLMWIVATVLVMVMFCAVTSRAAGGQTHVAPRTAAQAISSGH
jgi:hypothetical protein